MTTTTVYSWSRRSPRGSWHLTGYTGRALCGTHLGYGPSTFTVDPTRPCRRCAAKLGQL